MIVTHFFKRGKTKRIWDRSKIFAFKPKFDNNFFVDVCFEQVVNLKLFSQFCISKHKWLHQFSWNLLCLHIYPLTFSSSGWHTSSYSLSFWTRLVISSLSLREKQALHSSCVLWQAFVGIVRKKTNSNLKYNFFQGCGSGLILTESGFDKKRIQIRPSRKSPRSKEPDPTWNDKND